MARDQHPTPIGNFFGIVRVLVPVLICGGLVLYFVGVNNAFGGMLTAALGPTIIGIGTVGLLFCIPLALRLNRIFAGMQARPSPRRDMTPGEPGRDIGFDANAAIARHLARRAAMGPPGSQPSQLPAQHSEGPPRPSFGRKRQD